MLFRSLFDPSWGQYDLIIASKVISARPGAADYVSYYGEPPLLTPDDKEKDEDTPLESLYSEVRSLRENHIVDQDKWMICFANSLICSTASP